MDFQGYRKSIDLYLDGELDSASILKFQEWLDNDPRCRELLEREENLRMKVREALSSEHAPDTLGAGIRRTLRKEEKGGAKRFFTGWRAAAAILLAVIIGGGFYFQQDQRDMKNIVNSSINSHRMYSQAGDLMDFQASDESGLIPKLQQRVEFAVTLPSLAQDDIAMVGGRICILIDRQSALAFYKKGPRRLSLFAVDQKDIRLPSWGGKNINDRMVYFHQSGGYRVAVWKDGECIYSLVAQLEERDMTRYLTTGFKRVIAPAND